MTGCFVWWKCLVACLFFDESQHPTCPQIRHSLKWTQVSPISRHSLQPLPLGVTLRISFTCGQVVCSSGMRYLYDEFQMPRTGEDARACVYSSRNFSTSNAAMQPDPAAVIA